MYASEGRPAEIRPRLIALSRAAMTKARWGLCHSPRVAEGPPPRARCFTDAEPESLACRPAGNRGPELGLRLEPMARSGFAAPSPADPYAGGGFLLTEPADRTGASS